MFLYHFIEEYFIQAVESIVVVLKMCSNIENDRHDTVAFEATQQKSEMKHVFVVLACAEHIFHQY